LRNAAIRGHKDVVELLLAHGADVKAVNSRGRTPLDEAWRRGHAEIVGMLGEYESHQKRKDALW
jgi:ankyrin repeat protein